MNRYFKYSFVVLFILLFAACDQAKFPIDSYPMVKIDSRLLGNWRMKGRPEEYTLIKETDSTYMILYKNRQRSDIDKYPAYLSIIDGVKFLNVRPEDSASGFFFLKIISINPIKNVVAVTTVSDSTLKDITDPAEVREWITKNLNNPSFYSDTGYFYRIR